MTWSTDLPDAVRAWIANDPDPRTRTELTELLEVALTDGAPGESARVDLGDRFAGTLAFGTAGLRGAIGGGPNRMNRAVVIRATAGLIDYLTDELAGDDPPVVVIGYAARTDSDVFARDVAAVVTGGGGRALLLPRPLPTPVVAFAVRHLAADAGVVITASHNPPQDNGYKVYLGGRVVGGSGQGAQIVAPYDAHIAEHITAVGPASAVPRGEAWTELDDTVVEEYLAAVAGLAEPGPRTLRIVLTPLHGVGGELTARVLRGAGFTDLHVVPEQAEPDPAFPTVSFPNPEEPGAIDLALALADRVGADLVIANDPDADRCAAAVVDPRRVDPGATDATARGWRMLHGDEVGGLLGEYVARRRTEGVMASSIVSSRLLGRIAADHGLGHTETLTGFKWLTRVDGLVYGYEEALGYCVDPEHVRDKDGMSAALVIAQLAATVRDQGNTLVDLLDHLAVRHGLHLTDQLSARFTDLARIGETMDRVRSAPPTTLAGSPVVEVTDLSVPGDGPGALPPTDGLRLVAEDGTRVVVRPSGTEPKVKCYLEVIVPVAGGSDAADDAGSGPGSDPVGAARVTARRRLDTVRAEVAAALGLDQ